METFVLKKGERASVLARIASYLARLSPSRSWRVEITEDRATRSVQQCRYLNGVAYKRLSDATGYERDDISEFLCGTYFGWRTKKVPKKPGSQGSEQVPVRTTTTDETGHRSVLSTVEFMEYVSFVQRFGAQHGVYIPEPDEEFEEEARAA